MPPALALAEAAADESAGGVDGVLAASAEDWLLCEAWVPAVVGEEPVAVEGDVGGVVADASAGVAVGAAGVATSAGVEGALGAGVDAEESAGCAC